MPPTAAQRAKIHIAIADLGYSRETYEDILAMNFGGRTSSAQLSARDAEKLLGIFKAKGWKPGPRRSKKKDPITLPSDAQSRKILALWIELHRAGVVHDGSNRALCKFVKRLSGVDHLAWCNGQHKYRIIEALKEWAEREGVDIG